MINFPSNPLDRISPELKEKLHTDALFFDVHCHVFNYHDVPNGFLRIRLPFNDRFLERVEHFFHRIRRRTDGDRMSSLAYFIHFFRNKTAEETAGALITYYTERNVVICPLMMDMRFGIKGNKQPDFQIQIQKTLELCEKFPGQILPFFAADPNNPNLMEEFQETFRQDSEHGFFGIKIYPSLGYLPAHPRLMQLYETCAEKNIPVTAHCAGAAVRNSRKRIKNIEGFRYDENGDLTNERTTERFRCKHDYALFFNHPRNWVPVLDQFPGLKLNLAHFGGDIEWEKFYRGKSNNWVARIMDLMERFENVYTDFSYTLYVTKYAFLLRDLMEHNELLRQRVLYGSDYYMTVREGHFRNIRASFFHIMGDELIRQISHTNPLKFLFSQKA